MTLRCYSYLSHSTFFKKCIRKIAIVGYIIFALPNDNIISHKLCSEYDLTAEVITKYFARLDESNYTLINRWESLPRLKAIINCVKCIFILYLNCFSYNVLGVCYRFDIQSEYFTLCNQQLDKRNLSLHFCF